MEDNKYNVSDLVIAAVERQPVEFENAFNNIIVDKLSNAVAERKTEIAHTLFNEPVDFSEE